MAQIENVEPHIIVLIPDATFRQADDKNMSGGSCSTG